MKEIIVALATPFDKNDNINFDILDQMIARNISQGAAGFFVGGSAGEGMLLTLNERLELFDYLAKYTKKIKMIANVSALSVKEANILAKRAENLKFNWISSVIPYYYKHSMESIAAYYNGIMESCELPMLIYNFPGNSGIGFDLNHSDIISLFNHPKVIGIKHTNRDLYEMERMTRINPNLQIYNGYDETFLCALPLGIAGAIGSTFNITTPLFVKIADLYEQGELDKALEVQMKANIVMDAMISAGLIPSIKYMLEVLGMSAGKPRLPFLELSQHSKQKLENVVKEYLI